MPAEQPAFTAAALSLADITGPDFIQAVCTARAYLTGENAADLERIACTPVECYPATYHRSLLAHLPQVGKQVVPAAGPTTARGASSQAFEQASRLTQAPLSGCGFYRIGEDGRLYLTTKAEHYHLPLGHGFPGYQLLDYARKLGIVNATHNNTRGHITRLLEEELIRAAHGRSTADPLDDVLAPDYPGSLNRVLNLETGSLACEAALKMMLARFYAVQEQGEPPEYAGRIPVFLVIGDDNGEPTANYHGTTLLTQILRGMWPKLGQGLSSSDLYRVQAIRPNDRTDLEQTLTTYDMPPFKIAGFLHEIVMMNYGARCLSPDFLVHAYELCRRHDVPVLADEIQSCLWSPQLFLIREYNLFPTFLALGKGFPGGEYPASRLLFSAAYDNLPQFGALVTNGQEELASLAYVVTMRWVQQNRAQTDAVGREYQARLNDLADRHPQWIAAIHGRRHLAGITFHQAKQARQFCQRLNDDGLDISVQTYKTTYPPTALTKLPLTTCPTLLDFVLERMVDALAGL